MVDQVDWNNLQLNKELGFGSFSDVFQAIWTKKNGCREQIAVKVFRDAKSEKYNAREIKCLSEISHENIGTFYGISKNSESITVMLLEYADCGSLHDCLYMRTQDGHLYSYEYLDSLRWMHHLAKGMKYLHQRKIIHRDLKPHNLLLFDNYQTLKIADFGTVIESLTKSTEAIGTVVYMAPEISCGAKYRFDSDVYSYGIIFWEVLARKKPFSHFPNQNAVVIKFAVVEGKRPLLDEIKFKDVKQLIEKCWHNDLCNRPTMEMVVSCLHDFQRIASRIIQFESDIRITLENYKLMKRPYRSFGIPQNSEVQPQQHSFIRDNASVTVPVAIVDAMQILDKTGENKSIIDLEKKFGKRFHNVNEFFNPPPFLDIQKKYPSQYS